MIFKTIPRGGSETLGKLRELGISPGDLKPEVQKSFMREITFNIAPKTFGLTSSVLKESEVLMKRWKKKGSGMMPSELSDLYRFAEKKHYFLQYKEREMPELLGKTPDADKMKPTLVKIQDDIAKSAKREYGGGA